MRVILADDAVLIRHGLARLLTEHGLEVVAEVGRAAHELRAHHPHLAVLVLSQYVEVSYALKLIREGGQRLGYLLKDRVVEIPELTHTLTRLLRGECVIEPALVKQLVDAQHVDDPLADLTSREREVLALMAGGYTDRGIRERLFLSQKTVESQLPQTRPAVQPNRQPPRPRRTDLLAPDHSDDRSQPSLSIGATRSSTTTSETAENVE